MPKHSHRFVETYGGLVAYGLDRRTNEDTVQLYLQKFSDDRLMEAILPRMTDEDLEELFETTNRVMRRYLSDAEYHELFLEE